MICFLYLLILLFSTVIALDTSPTRLALARHNAQIYGVADRIEFILSDYLSFAKSYLSLPSSSKPQSENSHPARKIDVVFLSPPWGGPSYLAGSDDDITELTHSAEKMAPSPPSSSGGHPTYSLSSILPIHGAQLFSLSRRITRNIAFYLPRNTRLDEVSVLLSGESTQEERQNGEAITTDEQIEVEEEWMGTKLKALTCYFGGLVTGQEGF
jgi:trimethylguanosine synthase